LSLLMPYRPGGISFAPSLKALPKPERSCFLQEIFRLRGLGGRSAQDDMWDVRIDWDSGSGIFFCD